MYFLLLQIFHTANILVAAPNKDVCIDKDSRHHMWSHNFVRALNKTWARPPELRQCIGSANSRILVAVDDSTLYSFLVSHSDLWERRHFAWKSTPTQDNRWQPTNSAWRRPSPQGQFWFIAYFNNQGWSPIKAPSYWQLSRGLGSTQDDMSLMIFFVQDVQALQPDLSS